MCVAPDGVDFVVVGQPFFFSETFEACNSITVEEHTSVFGPMGVLTLRAGVLVVIENGVSIEPGGELVIEIDPSLIGTAPPP